MPFNPKTSFAAAALISLAFAVPASAQQPEKKREVEFDFADFSIGGELSVTPGGAQDIEHYRSLALAGEIPYSESLSAEGLFSQHDLPLSSPLQCERLLCSGGEVMEAALIGQSETRYFAQIGFGTNLDAETFQREPLNIVAVVDKSGSMYGRPLTLVKESLVALVEQLDEDDQLTIVLYGAETYEHFETTRLDRRGRGKALDAIEDIESAGSTAMEAGLRLGFDLALETSEKFDGNTRVMLFTDEQPNVGATDAQSFMGMAAAASQRGVGLTTLGAGVQFGAELATKVSSVRGGNLFFFPDGERMKEVFENELDTMVTQLATEVVLTVRPRSGLKVQDFYGVPGDKLQWGQDGSVSIEVATLFVSRRKGAIFFTLAETGLRGEDSHWVGARSASASIAEIGLRYTLASGERPNDEVEVRQVDSVPWDGGLYRGWMLVNQFSAMRAASAAYHERSSAQEAYGLIEPMAALYRQNDDAALREEAELVYKLESTLTSLMTRPLDTQSSLDPATALPLRYGEVVLVE